MRILAAILAVLCLAAIVGAQTNGTVQDGYTFRDGLWYYPGYSLGYTRTLHTRPGYLSCGVYHAGASYYQYTQVPAAATPAPVVYNADWKTQLFKLDQALADQQAYQKAYDALNAKYGFGGQGLIYGNQLFGVNATTQYGYTYNQVVQRGYPDADPTLLYQQAFQLAQGAQKFGSDATAGHLSLVGQDKEARARVAEINARAIAAKELLRLLDGPPVVQSKTAVFGPAQPIQPNNTPLQGAGANLQALQGIVANKCASCHSGNVKKGGVDLSNYLQFSPEEKQRVWLAITSVDPKTMMPRNPDGSAGQRLAPTEMSAFFAN